LLVVIAIIAILIGLLLPAVQKVREAAARAKCSNNLKQIGIALHAYHDSYSKLPNARGDLFGAPSSTNTYGATTYGGWLCKILPFAEQGPLYNNLYIWSTPYFDNYVKVVPIYLCPSDARDLTSIPAGYAGMTSYHGVTGSDTTFDAQYTGNSNGIFVASDKFNGGVPLTDIKDGTSNTLMVGERPPTQDKYWGWWAVSDYDCLMAVMNEVYENPVTSTGNPPCTAPYGRYYPGNPNLDCHANHFYSMHTGGANWALGDGSVAFIPYAGQPVTPHMASRDGGEVFDRP